MPYFTLSHFGSTIRLERTLTSCFISDSLLMSLFVLSILSDLNYQLARLDLHQCLDFLIYKLDFNDFTLLLFFLFSASNLNSFDLRVIFQY